MFHGVGCAGGSPFFPAFEAGFLDGGDGALGFGGRGLGDAAEVEVDASEQVSGCWFVEEQGR